MNTEESAWYLISCSQQCAETDRQKKLIFNLIMYSMHFFQDPSKLTWLAWLGPLAFVSALD